MRETLWRALGFLTCLSIPAAALLTLTGCASEPVKGDMQVIGYECDALGVKAVRILATGAELATIRWDNVTMCGDPT